MLLTLGYSLAFLRILCNGLCTARRIHTSENDHTCHIGCPDEPDSLTHYNECPRLYNIFLERYATILPPRKLFVTRLDLPGHFPNPLFPMIVPMHKNLAIIVHGWALFTDGATRVVDCETLAGGCLISRSHRGRIFLLFGPVLSFVAHLAVSGARIQSNNTAEMTARV